MACCEVDQHCNGPFGADQVPRHKCDGTHGFSKRVTQHQLVVASPRAVEACLRVVQQRKMVEVEAARQALEQQIGQTKAAYEHQILNDLSDAEKKVAQLSLDLIKAEQKTGEQISRSPIDGTVQQLVLHTVGGVVNAGATDFPAFSLHIRSQQRARRAA